ncbi:MAG: methylated-DNA--[protein]-cysteine S-methyltransferase [Alcanivoracaceae bacterium]|nr:methylated-DNA--[protein]-cysteine S-methyltransferase [Alcanivoracaceae bacterium]
MENNKKDISYYDSAIGVLKIEGNSATRAITGLWFVQDTNSVSKTDNSTCEYLENCKTQLDEYFAKKRKTFDIKIELSGSDFQKRTWNALQQIAFAQTISYKTLSQRINAPAAYRAVGNANNKNPISIIIPCHRVVASNGDLAGYGGGVWRKKWLLEHESSF